MFPRPVYVVDAVRTPIGRYRGGLTEVRPDDLAAHVLQCVIARNAALASEVHEVVFGATNGAGEDNRNVARMAVLLAGLPYELPAVTVNRLCGSGLEAVNRAAMAIALGDAEAVVAGGVESMTRAPFSMPKATDAYDRTPPTIYDTTIGWRYVNKKMAERFSLDSMGETAENVAQKYGITRESQDQFALESQRRAVAAWKNDAFAREIVAVPLPAKKGQATEPFARDESPREDTTLEKLAKLAPAFRKGGSVTAGNSSPINDGSAAVLLASEDAVKRANVKPLARVVSFGVAGVEPNFMGEGPIPASKKALSRAGWKVADLDLVELNEAFAAQSLACLRGLELDPAKVNVNGGSIALGHPIGCSGARIVATLLHAMRARGAKRGLASLCIGVGQGIATLFEAV
jgi:acetyl-CoA acyltransferase